MSNTPDNGGPAFPCAVFDPDVDAYRDESGLSLRDYFAAKAMQAMLSNFDWMQHTAKETDMPGEDAVTAMAYEIADAMLRARKT